MDASTTQSTLSGIFGGQPGVFQPANSGQPQSQSTTPLDASSTQAILDSIFKPQAQTATTTPLTVGGNNNQPGNNSQPQPGFMSKALNATGQFFVGADKGALSTVSNLESGLQDVLNQTAGRVSNAILGKGFSVPNNSPTMNQALAGTNAITPTSTGQKVGFGTEQIAEFFVPGLDEADAAKLAEAAGVSDKVAAIIKMGVAAAKNSGIVAAQRGTPSQIAGAGVLGAGFSAAGQGLNALNDSMSGKIARNEIDQAQAGLKMQNAENPIPANEPPTPAPNKAGIVGPNGQPIMTTPEPAPAGPQQPQPAYVLKSQPGQGTKLVGAIDEANMKPVTNLSDLIDKGKSVQQPGILKTIASKLQSGIDKTPGWAVMAGMLPQAGTVGHILSGLALTLKGASAITPEVLQSTLQSALNQPGLLSTIEKAAVTKALTSGFGSKVPAGGKTK